MLPVLSSIKDKADAFIFDVDGTLLDSMSVWNQADTVFLNSRGFEVTPDYTDYVKSVRIEDAALYTRERFNLPDTIEQIMDEWNAFVNDAYALHVPLKEGALTYLKLARENGLKTACATALTKPNLNAAFDRLGIHDLFDVIVTLEDLPGAPDKSDPHIYLHVADLLCTAPSRTIIFEDVPAALNGARKGGFLTCAVYDLVGAGSDSSWEQMRMGADYSFTTWNEALKN